MQQDRQQPVQVRRTVRRDDRSRLIAAAILVLGYARMGQLDAATTRRTLSRIPIRRNGEDIGDFFR
ncbi:hypothetical protein [Megasphaera vaginalis (ex Bordigoni et al. 2020)]|uniref:hypothetical protein n=1 Tax=Megasphaera vaginalis (ex Bordigoni et al. 2020) TaxID=2045301 RepID=UPI000C7D2230|nr:hypothetical protein [Megasphaera vaginalis (ex Bordigoni et al. 2020)]